MVFDHLINNFTDKIPHNVSSCNFCTLLGSDFNSDPVTLTIEVNATSGSARIQVKCDEIVERLETFSITLQLKNNNSEVTIDKNASVSMGQIVDSEAGMSGS